MRVERKAELPERTAVPREIGPTPKPGRRTEEDVIAAVAALLADNGYQFIPDHRLDEMKRALQPFLTAA